jgi:hypothetical protein
MYWDGLYGSGHWVPPDLPGDTDNDPTIYQLIHGMNSQ